MDPQQNRNLLTVTESILTSLIGTRSAELAKIDEETRNKVFSREGLEWYQTNPDIDSITGQRNATLQAIRSLKVSLQSVQTARNNGSTFNACSLCGSLVSIPAILEHSLTNKIPLKKLPCNACDKAKSVRKILKGK